MVPLPRATFASVQTLLGSIPDCCRCFWFESSLSLFSSLTTRFRRILYFCLSPPGLASRSRSFMVLIVSGFRCKGVGRFLMRVALYGATMSSAAWISLTMIVLITLTLSL